MSRSKLFFLIFIFVVLMLSFYFVYLTNSKKLIPPTDSQIQKFENGMNTLPDNSVNMR